jgi:hypothetical protein
MTDFIDYVIVVHGIGEQRPNETVLPVINRFAEIRQNAKDMVKKQVVSLGMVTSQSGKPVKIGNRVSFGGCTPWSEYKYIPKRKPEKPLPPFFGEPARDGSNIRFVDMYWADIMQSHFNDVGQPVKRWGESLIGRLERKEATSGMDESASWVLPVLYNLEETFSLMHTAAYFKVPFMSEKIFNDYLGDIQLYGEYSAVRGEAVKRFHELFEKIESHHKKIHQTDDDYFQAQTQKTIRPRYTIIAHSLGSLMAMEGIMYGHYKYHSETVSMRENLPFDGYLHPKKHYGEPLGKNWIDNIDNFVTLGAPIDKFLILWWNNYQYLNFDDFLVSRKNKIRHYNYCDEQDPVAHSLDNISKKPAFKKLFVTKEDIIYSRYIIPGSAHVEYWNDYELFERILAVTIDNEPFNDQTELTDCSQKRAFEICEPKTYAKVLFYTYLFLPIVNSFLLTLLFCVAFYVENLLVKGLATTVFVTYAYVAARVTKMMIWWRQILRSKIEKHEEERKQQQIYMGRFVNVLRFIVLGHLFAALLYLPFEMYYTIKVDTSEVPIYDFIIVNVGSLLLTWLIHAKFTSLRVVKIIDRSAFWTLLTAAGIFVVSALMTYFDFIPLMYLFKKPYVFVSAYWQIAVLVWFHTVYSYYAANRVLGRM